MASQLPKMGPPAPARGHAADMLTYRIRAAHRHGIPKSTVRKLRAIRPTWR